MRMQRMRLPEKWLSIYKIVPPMHAHRGHRLLTNSEIHQA